MRNITYLIRYLRDDYKRIAAITFVNMLLAGVTAGLPLIFRNIVNAISSAATQPGQNFWQSVGINLVLLAGILIGYEMLRFFNEKLTDTMRMHTLNKLRLAIFPHLLNLSVDYSERHRAGTILQRVNQGIMDFSMWFWNLSEWLMSTIMGSVFILIFLWFKLPVFGIIFTSVLPIMILINIRKVRKSKVYRETGNRYYEHFSGYMSETVSNLATIKSLSAEKTANSTFRRYIMTLQSNRFKQFKIERWHNSSRDMLGALAVIASISYVAYEAFQGRFSPGDVFLIALYGRDLIQSVQPISRFINDTADVDVTAGRLVKMLEAKPTLQDTPDATELTELKTVEFKNVSFGYPDGKKGAVKNISFTIDHGKTVALVGPSGVGKSTITKLLLRFYQPTEGQILVNGHDISHFTQDSIRAHMGMVMQDVALFNATINENLAIANAKADDATIQKAARQAHAEEFIAELPKGYKTQVGERGIKLSGGQKQRVAIARAILKDPDLIILDEATSALDSESERLVQEGLHRLMNNRSAMIIAHRMSTVMHADEILVLQKGRVIERGGHKQLMDNDGLYAKLFHMQSATGKVEL